MSGPDGAAWAEAAEAARAALGIEVLSRMVDASTPSFAKAYGIGSTGASLIRPDGYVAWRAESHTADAGERLTAAMRQVLSLA